MANQTYTEIIQLYNLKVSERARTEANLHSKCRGDHRNKCDSDLKIVDELQFFCQKVFKQNAIFEGCHFLVDLLSTSTYIEWVSFKDSILEKKIEFSVRPGYENQQNYYSFSSDVSFKRAVFKDEVLFEKVHFKSKVEFNKAVFLENVEFKKCVFHDDVFFNDTVFGANVTFKDCTFKGAVDFRLDKNKSDKPDKSFYHEMDCDFSNSTFERKVVFYHRHFPKSNFYNTKFEALADFYKTIFSEPTRFHKTDFLDIVVFSKATFKEAVVFHYVKVKSNMILRDSTLSTQNM